MTKLSKTVKFTECLNDTWDYFFLGDPDNLFQYKSANNLPDDLMSDFVNSHHGDLVVSKGVMVPLSGIRNSPYTVYFQVNVLGSVFNDKNSVLQFRQSGYILEVISKEIYLMTLPYLKQWTMEKAIKSLKTNGIRPKINLQNGRYKLDILGGVTQQDSGLEPTIEFRLIKNDQAIFNAQDINFRFTIT